MRECLSSALSIRLIPTWYHCYLFRLGHRVRESYEGTSENVKEKDKETAEEECRHQFNYGLVKYSEGDQGVH